MLSEESAAAAAPLYCRIVDSPQRPGIPDLLIALRRGLRGRCPRCGEGRIFRRLIDPHERCSSCALRLQRNYGDTWIYIIILDRIPIIFGLAAVYFGFRSATFLGGAGFFLALAIPLIATLRHRHGLALGLDYLTRIYFPDPADEIHLDQYVFAPGKLNHDAATRLKNLEPHSGNQRAA